MYDQRLFNQDTGVATGLGGEDSYNIYDKPLFADRSELFKHKVNRCLLAWGEAEGCAAERHLLATPGACFQLLKVLPGLYPLGCMIEPLMVGLVLTGPQSIIPCRTGKTARCTLAVLAAAPRLTRRASSPKRASRALTTARAARAARCRWAGGGEEAK
jgi:hypothetical protein